MTKGVGAGMDIVNKGVNDAAGAAAAFTPTRADSAELSGAEEATPAHVTIARLQQQLKDMEDYVKETEEAYQAQLQTVSAENAEGMAVEG